MPRTVMLVGKTASGSFVDPITGQTLACVSDDNGVTELVKKYNEIRDAADGVIKRGKAEIRLSEMMLNSTNTAGGMLKARVRFK